MLLRRAATVVLLGLLAGCATGGAGPTADGTERNPVIPSAGSASDLRPGDSLTVAILGVPDPSTNAVQVDDQGLINLPYIGTVKAAGLTTGKLTQEIRNTYYDKKIYTSVEVSVSVTERYVYVGGEVVKPGRIVWTPDLTASKAVQAAGGFTLYAKETRVGVVRNQVLYTIDVKLAQRSPAQDPRLDPGDSLEVPRSAF